MELQDMARSTMPPTHQGHLIDGKQRFTRPVGAYEALGQRTFGVDTAPPQSAGIIKLRFCDSSAVRLEEGVFCDAHLGC